MNFLFTFSIPEEADKRWPLDGTVRTNPNEGAFRRFLLFAQEEDYDGRYLLVGDYDSEEHARTIIARSFLSSRSLDFEYFEIFDCDHRGFVFTWEPPT